MFTFTFYDLLARNLPARQHHPALVCGTGETTYGELAQQADRVAAWLHQQGVRRGDFVGIHLHKCSEEIVATLATARLGAVFVNVNYQWTLEQLQYVADDCGLRVLFTDERRAGEIARTGLLEKFQQVIVTGRAPSNSRAVSWSHLPWRACPDVPGPIDVDLAALLYTSGSTGAPKGVMLTHQNLIQGARIVARYLNNTAEDRVLSVLPLSFDYGLNQVTTMFLVGGTVVLQGVVMPTEIVKSLLTQGVTGMAAVPPLWIQLARFLQEHPAELPTLRYITNSGGKIPDTILEALPRLLPHTSIYLMYGLTEAFRSTFLPPEMYQRKMGSIGRAIPNVDIFVVDPEKGVCGPGHQGELIHRGSLISQGYYRQPQATAEKIKPCPHLARWIGEEKVVHSGDLVRVDEDGYLWFVSRLDSLIKCSGFRISPTEVEDIVCRSKLVDEVVAFGVQHELLGQAVEIAVASAKNHALDTHQLLQYCKEHMPNYMVPQRTHVWTGEMPRGATGKIDRPSVIKACVDGSLD
jgi:acyl-CoA ligase (AMP-forming) (exosortase A-associated)